MIFGTFTLLLSSSHEHWHVGLYVSDRNKREKLAEVTATKLSSLLFAFSLVGEHDNGQTLRPDLDNHILHSSNQFHQFIRGWGGGGGSFFLIIFVFIIILIFVFTWAWAWFNLLVLFMWGSAALIYLNRMSSTWPICLKKINHSDPREMPSHLDSTKTRDHKYSYSPWTNHQNSHSSITIQKVIN